MHICPRHRRPAPRRALPEGGPPGRRAHRRGVGLIEFMLASLLVALIAAVAIPQFLDLRRKAMRAEPAPNLRAIGVAQQAWYAAESSWLDTEPNPTLPAGRELRDFDRQRPDWRDLGWYPEGQVRCSYETVLLDRASHVRADAYCDLDGDRHLVIIRYEVPSGDSPGEFLDLYPERY